MASPITWQNVNNLQGYGVASEALEASRNSMTDGLSMIGQSMNNYVEDERQQNTDAFLNQLNNYKDAKELNTAIESGGIQELRDSFGLLDQKATRNAGTNRLDSLRAADEKELLTQDRVFDREDAATARTKAKLQQAAAPILDEATSLGAQGKFAEGRQLLEANSAALIDAGVYGRAQQGITSTQNTWETQQIQQSTSKENRDFTREQRQEVRDRKARVNKVNSLMNASVSNYKTMGANRVTYNVGDEVPNGNVNGDTPTHTQTIRDTMDTITQEFPNLTPSERSAMRADLNQQLGDASGLAERERDSLNNQISQVDLQLIGNDYHIAAGTTASARAESIIANALELNTELNEQERVQLIRTTLQKVGLLADHMNFYPHMFSGGQKQRISLARAIILQPQVIILDEALASLDPSLRSQMINLLLDLQQQMGLAFILISHNLGIVKHFSDDTMVLSDGKVVEYGKTSDVMKNPKHKYTQKLLMSQQFQLLHR